MTNLKVKGVLSSDVLEGVSSWALPAQGLDLVNHLCFLSK